MAKIGVLLNEGPRPWHISFVNNLESFYGAGNVLQVNGSGWTDIALEPLADNLIAWQADVIVTADTPTTQAAAARTKAHNTLTGDPLIPVVAAHVSDPSQLPIEPNVTSFAVDLTAKAPLRLAILAALLRARHLPVGVVWNDNNDSKRREGNALILAAGGAPPPTLSTGAISQPITAAYQIAQAVADVRTGNGRSLAVLGDPLLVANSATFVPLADWAPIGLPTIYASRDAVQAGGLVSYGLNRVVLWTAARGVVDSIISAGALPATTPSIPLEVVVNGTTAARFGLTPVPSTLAGQPVIVI